MRIKSILLAILLISAPYLAVRTYGQPAAPTSLKTDYAQEPHNDPANDEAGLENPNPIFSWTADTTTNQTACQVVVSTDTTDISHTPPIGSTWDSQKVSTTNENITYSGQTPLVTSEKYYWKVRTWDNSEDSSPYSTKTYFCTNMFIKHQVFDVTSKRTGFAAGDINNDGLSDFIRADWNMDTVTAYLNTDTGTFKQHWQTTDNDAYSEAVALADLDSDGDLDLIILNSIGPNNVSDTYIYKNDGTGNFSLFKSITDGNGGCTSIATADIDRDGDIDFIEGVDSGDNVLYRNDGTGNFTMTEITDKLDDSTKSILLTDLNKDTYPDLITGNYEEANRVYLNDGNGNFTLHTETDKTEPTLAIALTDFEGNGDWDYIAANGMDTSNSNCHKDRYYRNDGSGNFASNGQSLKLDDSYALSVADIDNDGFFDYIQGNQGTDETTGAYERTYLSNGDGTFEYANISRGEPAIDKTLLFDFAGNNTVDLLRGEYDHSNKYLLHQTTTSNSPPEAPANLEAFHDGDGLYLGWGEATDDHTLPAQLTYNIRIGAETGNYKIISGIPATDDNTGSFKGNIGRSTYVYLNIPCKTYFWQVAAIDTAKTAGAWSDEMIVNTNPYGGWDSDGVIPSTAATERGYSFCVDEPPFSIENGLRGLVDIRFKIRDKESNNCSLTDFHYSTGTGINWHTIEDSDNGLTSPGNPNQDSNWPDNGGSYFESTPQYGQDYYSFTWDSNDMSEIGVNDFESSNVRIKFKVKDVHLATSSYVVSDPFYIDNMNPSAPGTLKDSGKYFDTSYTLKFSTPSQDTNFREYKIFGADTDSVSQYFYDFVWDSPNDPNLGYIDFNGASSTTVTGLVSDTLYYFILYAYDDYANFGYSPQILSVKTNDPPDISIDSVEERKDASGLVDIVFSGIDNDSELSNYLWDELYYREKPSNPDNVMTPAFYDNSFSSGPLSFEKTISTYTFVWDAGADVPGYSNDTFIVKLKVDDTRNTGDTGYSKRFTIDTLPPVMDEIWAVAATAKSIGWEWDSAIEDNFARYRLWYSSKGADYVIDKDTANAEYLTISEKAKTSTTTYNLKKITRYWACVWAEDNYGYSSRSATSSCKTGFSPNNSIVGNPQLIRDGSGKIDISYKVTDRDGNICNTKVEYSLDDGNSWQKAFVEISSAAFGTVSVNNTKEYQIRDIVTTYDSEIITNTITFNWLSKKDIDNVTENNVSIRITTEDDAISGKPDKSISFKIDNSQPKYNINQWSLSEYNHSKSLFKIRFIGEDSESEMLLSTQTALDKFIIYNNKDNHTTSFTLAGSFLSVQNETTLSIKINKSKRDSIARWDGEGKTPYLRLLSSATRDIYGNYSLPLSSAVFDSNITWASDETRPEVTGATYAISGGDIYLNIAFSENMDNLSFSTAVIGGIIIKDAIAATSNIEPLDSNCEIITTEPDTDNLKIRIPYGKHDIIWNWNSELLYISISSSTISDLSANPVVEISTNSSIPINTDISTGTPKVVTKTPPSEQL